MSKDRDKILEALTDSGELSSAQLSKRTGIWSGWLYPALFDLERQGLVTSRWDVGPYPRRRLYRLESMVLQSSYVKIPEDLEPQLEKLARRVCTLSGIDPDIMVQDRHAKAWQVIYLDNTNALMIAIAAKDLDL